MKTLMVLVLLSGVAFVGCNSAPKMVERHNFQISGSSVGEFLVDTETGRTWILDKSPDEVLFFKPISVNGLTASKGIVPIGKAMALPANQDRKRSDVEADIRAQGYDVDATPNPGDIEDGYKFKGGNPSDQKNWERLSIPKEGDTKLNSSGDRVHYRNGAWALDK